MEMTKKDILTIEEIVENNRAFYVFDTEELEDRLSTLRSYFDNKVEFCYAIKANTFVTATLAERVERLEICSPGEYRICKDLGISSDKMVISGIYKDPIFVENLLKKGDFKGILTVESLGQYEMFKTLSEKFSVELRVLLRLTNNSQFGINSEDICKIIGERENFKRIDHIGLQYFSGTQKTSIKKYRRELKLVDDLLLDLKSRYGYEAEELEYGTGFPVAYFLEDKLDEESLLTDFAKDLASLTFKGRLILEIGRSLVASCGNYYCPIVDIKENGTTSYILVDGGMHQHVYDGQYMAMKSPYINLLTLSKGKVEVREIEQESGKKSWTICGSLCSMNDILAKNIGLVDFKIGDYLVFRKSGAYSMTEGMALFLSRDLPAIYLRGKEDIENNSSAYIYKRLRDNFETYELNY